MTVVKPEFQLFVAANDFIANTAKGKFLVLQGSVYGRLYWNLAGSEWQIQGAFKGYPIKDSWQTGAKYSQSKQHRVIEFIPTSVESIEQLFASCVGSNIIQYRTRTKSIFADLKSGKVSLLRPLIAKPDQQQFSVAQPKTAGKKWSRPGTRWDNCENLEQIQKLWNMIPEAQRVGKMVENYQIHLARLTPVATPVAAPVTTPVPVAETDIHRYLRSLMENQLRRVANIFGVEASTADHPMVICDKLHQFFLETGTSLAAIKECMNATTAVVETSPKVARPSGNARQSVSIEELHDVIENYGKPTPVVSIPAQRYQVALQVVLAGSRPRTRLRAIAVSIGMLAVVCNREYKSTEAMYQALVKLLVKLQTPMKELDALIKGA